MGFVVGQGMPDDWSEHFGVAQESPGLPAHCEDQVRQSVVAQSLQGHLRVKKDRQTVCNEKTDSEEMNAGKDDDYSTR